MTLTVGFGPAAAGAEIGPLVVEAGAAICAHAILFAGAHVVQSGISRAVKDLTTPDMRQLLAQDRAAFHGFTEQDVPNFSFRDGPTSFYSGSKALAEEATLACDLFLVLGSSLVVTPAALFPVKAKQYGAKLVIVNREPTPLDDIADLVLHDEIGHVLAGNRWYRFLCEQRGLEPVATYAGLAARYQAPKLRAPFNLEARRAAGFTDAELAALERAQLDVLRRAAPHLLLQPVEAVAHRLEEVIEAAGVGHLPAQGLVIGAQGRDGAVEGRHSRCTRARARSC